MSDQDNLITINVNGTDHQVPAGINVVDAAESVGVEIPHYCYHPKLTVSGNCRMCLVELGMPMKDRETGEAILDDDGNPKISFMPKPAIACATNAAPGMHIRTDSDVIKECRNGVMEFLLVNHPLDCPICDQAGECRLQEFSTEYGRGFSRFVEEKNVKPKRTRLGPRVTLDDERCILCSRCIRFSKEIANDDVLGFVDRGSYSTLTCYPGKELENNYSLNTVDICPVGALTSTDFRFKMRVWFLKPTPSICTESSVGVNTEVWSREGKIYRITPRRNDEVNDTWMSDSGRDLFKPVDSDDRLLHYTIDGSHKDPKHVAEAAAKLLKDGGLAYVGSGQMSVEEQFQLRQLVEKEPGPVYFISHKGEGDELLISSDRTPNLRGGLINGLIKDIPSDDFSELAAKIDSGDVKTILCCGENLTDAGISADQLKKVKVIYLGTHANCVSEKADIVLPGLSVFEKEGSFVNQQFRLQKFSQCVPGPSGVLSDVQTLSLLLASLNDEESELPTVSQVWSEISKKVNILKGLSYDEIPATGKLLDGSEFDKLSFCEGKTLHYKDTEPEEAVNA